MTTRERFERVRSLFVGARAKSAAERRGWLEAECAGDLDLILEVEELLARADTEERMDARVESHSSPSGDAPSADASARATGSANDGISSSSHLVRGAHEQLQRIGDYEILHVIGSGGMGTVYAAEQKQPRRRIALKVLHGGVLSERARRRFEYEAELLGRLRHPGIAHIYEAGVADSGLGPQPFLAMELVDGEPLACWVVRAEPSTRRKLELFIELCLAAQHAHERGVIHRDLKPDNILVERDGKPKVLDFGIARAIGPDVALGTRLTEAGAIIGTLPYMSPERLADDPDAIDTRSDVYSLGVILYELVAGRRPHAIEGLAIGKVIEKIRFDEAAPLTNLANVPRDLSIIVAKAIDRDPARRYASAGALADDVQRLLRDEAISARPASTLYQVQKLVRRHRAFAIGFAAVVAMLVLGLAGTLWQAHNAETRRLEAEREKSVAETERALAVRNAAETKLVADFQSRILENLSIDEFGHAIAVEQRKDLSEAMARLGREPADVERSLASFDATARVGNPTNVARRVLDQSVFAPAVETLEKDYADKPAVAAMIQTPLSATLRSLGLYDLGVRAARHAVEAQRKELGVDDPDTLTSMNALALLLRAQGKLDEAEPIAREVVERRRATLGDRHRDTLESIDSLALVLQDVGNHAEAERLYAEAIAGQRSVLGDDDVDTLCSINNLALLLQIEGKLAEAEPLLRETLRGHRARLGADNVDTLIAMQNLAVTLREQDKLAEAEPLLREAVAGMRAKLGDEHPRTNVAIGCLSGLLASQEKFAEAEPLAREALAGMRARLGDAHPDTLTAIDDLSTILVRQQKFDEAEPLAREALAGFRAKFGDEHPQTDVATNNLAVLLYDNGKQADAEPLYRETLAHRRARFGNTHPITLHSINNLARCLREQGKLDDAEPLYREALAGRSAKLGAGDVDTLRSQAGLASVLQSRNEFAEAAPLFEQTIELGRKLPPSDSKQFVHDMETRLRDLYRAWSKLEPSAEHDRRAAELDEALKAR